MSELSQLIAGIPTRKAVVAAQKARGGRVAAVYPIHYPRSLFYAFDVLPMEVWGPPHRDTTRGDAHLQAYTCSIVRGGLSFLLSGGLDAVDVVVVPHACDSLQGFGSLLIDFVQPRQPVMTLYGPRGPTRASTDFLTNEIRRVHDRLAELTGKRPDAEALARAVALDESADDVLARLLTARRRFDVSDRDFYRLVRSREYLPPEEFEKLGRAALDTANGAERRGVPVVLSGIVPEPMEILDALGDAGAVAAADDFAAVGRRVYPAGKSDEPLRRMAERLMAGPPDSTRGSAVGERVSHLNRLAQATDAKAVLFFVVKFCEPELFYLPQMRAELEKTGLRSLVIEADVTDALPHQAVTRVEALMETVS